MAIQNKITMLGAGNALATRCYNTCFILQSAGGGVLLADAGGGNGILAQLERAGRRREDIHDIFVTHAHTDHFLGVVWIVRMALQFGCRLNVWSHEKAIGLLDGICRQMLPRKEVSRLGDLVIFHRLEDGEVFCVGDMRLQCFDIRSAKERQFGFAALLVAEPGRAAGTAPVAGDRHGAERQKRVFWRGRALARGKARPARSNRTNGAGRWTTPHAPERQNDLRKKGNTR